MQKASKTIGQATKDIQRKMRGVQQAGQQLTAAVTLPLTAAAGASLKAASDWETAFAGVRKTVDATESQFAELSKGIRDMSKEIPASAEAIAGVAEKAGQLGIQTESILSFSRTMVDLGETTNLSADQAATSLARLANITEMPEENFDRLGSTIVDLGNNLATTEKEIAEMGQRLAGAGEQVGLAEDQILSLAGAMSSLGIRTRMGGTSMSRAFRTMNTAVKSGGETLEAFAETAGMTAQEFSRQFEEDAAQAMVSFVEGLQRVQREGGDVAAALERADLTGEQVNDVFGRLAGSGDLLARSLELGNEAWRENTALTEEAQKRYSTFASRMQTLWNRVKDLGRVLGGTLIPVVEDLITHAMDPLLDSLENLVQGWDDLTPSVRRTWIALGAVAAAIPPLLASIGTLGLALPALAGGFQAVGTAALYAWGAITSPVTLAVGAVAAVGFAVKELYDNWDYYWNRIQRITFVAVREMMKGVQDLYGVLGKLGSGLGKLVPGAKAVGAAFSGASMMADKGIARINEEIDNLDENLEIGQAAKEGLFSEGWANDIISRFQGVGQDAAQSFQQGMAASLSFEFLRNLSLGGGGGGGAGSPNASGGAGSAASSLQGSLSGLDPRGIMSGGERFGFEEMAESAEKAGEAIQAPANALQKMQQAAGNANQAWQQYIGSVTEGASQARVFISELAASIRLDIGRGVQDAVRGIGRAFEDAILGAQSFGEAIKQMVKRVLARLAAAIAQTIIWKTILAGISAATGGAGAGLGLIDSGMGGAVGGGMGMMASRQVAPTGGAATLKLQLEGETTTRGGDIVQSFRAEEQDFELMGGG